MLITNIKLLGGSIYYVGFFKDSDCDFNDFPFFRSALKVNISKVCVCFWLELQFNKCSPSVFFKWNFPPSSFFIGSIWFSWNKSKQNTLMLSNTWVLKHKYYNSHICGLCVIWNIFLTLIYLIHILKTNTLVYLGLHAGGFSESESER